ncbi:MAG TPA: ferritin-like domain-containing protein [Acidimicrobiales bacterium]
MEISEHQLRQMAADVDEMHNDGMTSMASEIQELHAATRDLRHDRRHLLKKAGAGTAAALALGSGVLPIARLVPAFGQTLTDGDIAAFAASVELTAVAAYTMAAESGKLQPAVKDVGVMFAGHHQAHADAFNGAAGAKAVTAPNAKLLAALGPDLTKALAADQAAILEFAMTVENAAAATYLFALGALQSAAALKLTASILPVESQHAVVLGTALGKSGKDLFPAGGTNNGFETDAAALRPDKFPVS